MADLYENQLCVTARDQGIELVRVSHVSGQTSPNKPGVYIFMRSLTDERFRGFIEPHKVSPWLSPLIPGTQQQPLKANWQSYMEARKND